MKKWIAEKLGKIAIKEVRNSFSEVSNQGWFQPDLDSDLIQQLVNFKKKNNISVH